MAFTVKEIMNREVLPVRRSETVQQARSGLLYGGVGVSESIVWVESVHNVRTRLIDLLTLPQDSAELTRLLKNREHLRFRVGPSNDPEARAKATERLRQRARQMIGHPRALSSPE